MTPTEPTVKIRSPRTGIFATLRALLHTQGTGAPSRLALAFALSLSALALTATPALAAAPETPELKVEPVFATLATFNGVLSPKGLVPAEGEYKFLYKASPTECEGGSETTPGLALGGAPEVLPPEQVKGLTPATEYTVCLQITNPSIETATSLPVTFKTAAAAPPEPPEPTEVTERKATTATLNGVVNPLKEGEPGHYRFIYSQSSSVCTGGSETTEEAAPGPSPQPVSAAITGLEPGKPYTFCVKAFNALGEATLSTPKTFKTALPPETPETKPATEITGTTAKLNGVLNPKAKGDPGTFEFLYRASATECEAGARAPEPAGAAPGLKEEAVSAPVTGLLPTTQYTFCLRAHNEAGEESALSPPVTFTTPAAAPTVTGETLVSAGATEATLRAQINPGGVPTTYRVEYGTSLAYGSTTPEASAGAGSVAASVQIQLAGLQPATAYHARVIPQNELGPAVGSDLAFTTSPSGGPTSSTLPDGRAYELVSPPNVGDGEAYVPSSGHELESSLHQTFSGVPVRAAAGGNAVAYVGEPPIEGGNGSTGNGQGNAFLATRGASGWTAQSIMPPNPGGENYMGFSGDLSLAFLTAGEPALTADAPPGCAVLYSRTATNGAYQAAFTTTRTPGNCGYPLFAGVSADNTHVIFESRAALTPESDTGGPGQENLYESTGGHLYLINVLPSGKPDTNATFGGISIEEGGTEPGLRHFGQVISHDGSRIVWTDLNTGNLYVRIDATAPGARTVQADASVGGAGQFWGASSDGSKVFFTKEGDLYEYSVATTTTVDLAPAGKVLGVIGSGDDGSRIYFVASGVLASNENGNKEVATQGEPNLYVRAGGKTTYIATLSPEDNTIVGPSGNGEEPHFGDWRASLKTRTAEVTPDGQHVVFMSRRSITGYNNMGGCHSSVGSGNIVGCPEVFAYDAGTQQLSCASCNPNGAPPVAAAAGEPQKVGGAFLPNVGLQASGTYTFRWISDDGSRVFFDTAEPLVPQDNNGVQDVYEWERAGTGSCRQSQGCIYLISSNLSSEEAYFIDASASGNDIFFTTRAKLVPQDHLEAVKVYDARVGGGFPEISQACADTGCQGVPPAPPIFATPASVTFNGVGNFTPPLSGPVSKPLTNAQKLAKALKACRAKHNKRKRAGCESQARKQYRSSKAKKSNVRGK